MTASLDPARTALVVIDMQRDFLDERGYAAQAGLEVGRLREAIPGVQRLLACARAAGVWIVHTREANAPDLSDVPPAFLAATHRSGAPVGSPGPLGRFLIRGEYGAGIVDDVAPADREPVIDKPGFSAFEGTPLDAMLRAKGIQTLVLCGITTEVCVSSTLRTAVDRGFRCVTVRDACASAYPDLHDAALRMIEVEGGVFGEVADTADIERRLSRT
ncbi:MAG: isochorismatase family protein [Betaproteobacteria bacterium]|nr:isochorismatase family protein [Betaproteobacteria bacterium]